ncbi:universal stress protein [Rugosimonospora africana]|uniref:universal stress protein n=1 Tax=Rugosimonospora africana TaxID=556532 RepID=UPI0019407776|nr:universal stress protein [Rugosimonospora africana]
MLAGSVDSVMRSGPVIYAFDGSPAAEHALREGAAVFATRHALVVSVWEAGIGFQVSALPVRAFEAPAAPLDSGDAFQVDEDMHDAARRTAERGAQLARQAGLAADAMAAADQETVADTLVRLARELDGQAIVLGSHSRGPISSRFLGSTSRDVLEHATCPVLVVRHESKPDHKAQGKRPLDER